MNARTPRRGALVVAVGGLMGILGAAAVAPIATTAGAGVNAAADYWAALPTQMPDELAPQRSTILAADGSKIAEFFSENRRDVKLAQIAPVARAAVVAVEDDRFYEHGPIDVRGTLRAAVNNSADSGGRQGGSTLTQQYVKNVLLNAAVSKADKARATEISLPRKMQEAKLAGVVEKTMSKDAILEGYLNIAYFGDGAYGIEMAAEHYFSAPAAELTLPQAALLAGLVQNPEGYAPTKHPREALERRTVVLARMRQTGHITPAQEKAAKVTPLGLKPSVAANGCATSRYPFYCQWVRSILSSDPVFGSTQAERDQFLYRGGLTIRTHLDPKVVDVVQKVADDALGQHNAYATAIAVVEPGTGRVVGFAQNRPWGGGRDQTYVAYASRRTFQPGSTFKPITYATGLENGFPVNGTLNAPEYFTNPAMKGRIRNDGSQDVGLMDAGTATARSSNTWFATLEERVGVLKTVAMANRLGLSIDPRRKTSADYATTLGVDSASPIEMAGVYASFAAHGVVCRPVAIASITRIDGAKVEAPKPSCHQEVRAGVADAVTMALTQTVDGPDPARTGKGLGIGRPVAAKSGTTENSVGVWFAGYTPQYATAVWIGDPDTPNEHPVRSVRVYGAARTGYGAAAAGPVWSAAMKAAHDGLPVQQFARVGPAEVSGAVAVVPDLRGLATEQAIQVAHASGLDLAVAPTTAPAAAATPKDTVVGQSPAAGSTTGLTGRITVTLSAGSTTSKVVPPR